MQEEENIGKVGPYQKLQAILSEGKSSKDLKLTDKANDIIDELIGEQEQEETFWNKVKSFFKKIDSKIFTKGPKITNKYTRR